MKFDPTFVLNPNVSLQFPIISDDVPITVFSSYKYVSGISYFFISICSLALLLFLIGSYVYKMIGVESLFVIELMTFLRIFVFK